MNEVLTPDGWGQVLRTQSAHGRTSYLVKGAGFEGWYDGLQVTADFADQPDDIIPNDENEVALPYPSRPQGPGWDGSTSTIPPDIDPHLEMDGNSDSLTGNPTSEDAEGADLDSDFEPNPHLAGHRARRLHFASSDDPILDVSELPEESPTGLENSPINPDGVSTDDLFEREAAATYDRLVIEDDFSFMRFAADEDGDGDDDNKKERRGQPDFFGDDDDDDSDDDDSDDSSDSDSDSSDGDSDGSDGGDGGGDGGGGHTAAFREALTTTADLHFLANLCVCSEKLPLHSKSEHRELLVEASDVEGANPQSRDLEKLYERYEQRNFNYQESNLPNLVDNSEDSGDNADLFNHYASLGKRADGYDKYIGSNGDGSYHLIASGDGKLSKGQHYGHYDSYQDAHNAVEAIIARNHSKTAAPAQPAQPTQIESQIEQLMQFWAVDNNGWWHWTGSQSDLALLNQMQQQMMAVGMPSGPPGQMQAQAAFSPDEADAILTGTEEDPGGEGFEHHPGGDDDTYYRSEAVPGRPGWLVTHRITHNLGDDTPSDFSYSAWLHQDGDEPHMGAPIPVGLDGDDSVVASGDLNRVLDHHAETSMRLRNALKTEASRRLAAPALLAALPELAGAGEAAGAAGAAGEGAAASQGARGMAGNLMGGMPSPAGAMSGAANALADFNGGTDLGVAHKVPFRSYSFTIEANTPPQWREYLQTVASDKLVALAAWRDVVDKSKRLRAEGAINVEVFKPEVITAYIQGDHGRYYTTVQRLGSVAPGVGRQLTSTQVSGWSCECEWGHWAWIRKRSFVGRMCSHAYALFSEMRSLDAKARKNKGKPLSAGKFASVAKTAWARTQDGFNWVSDDPAAPTAAIIRTASGWNAQVWSDGTADDSLNLGTFRHSKYALRAVGRVVNAHMKFAEQGDVDMVGGDDQATFQPYAAPDSISGAGDNDPYSEDGAPEDLLAQERQEGSPGIQESTTRVGFSVFAESATGDDDEGPESQDDGIEEEEPDDDETLDEEIAEDEDDSNDGQDDEGGEPVPEDDGAGDGGHYEEHKRDDSDDDGDEGTDNPGDDSDDDGIEKHSSVAELQQKYGLQHLAGANYSLTQQAKLVAEGEGKQARNRGDLNLNGTHYEASSAVPESPEDTLAFLF